MLKSRVVILLVFFCALGESILADTDSYRKCNPHHMNDCPEWTICTQSGECRCWQNFIYNPAHARNASADYCIHKPSNPSSLSNVGIAAGSPVVSSSVFSPSNGSNQSTSSKTASAISQLESPGAHHLVGGILIPVIFVMAAIGIIYSVKRLNLFRRAREAFTRRNRPFYEDVMMGNDNDDPPLI